MPEAFVNLLGMLGWNDGTDQEIFTLPELIEKFSVERISKAGAKFDFEKAKWYNHEWIKNADASQLLEVVKQEFATQGTTLNDDAYTLKVIDLVKDRCNLLTDFILQSGFFFTAPVEYDLTAVKGKWTTEKTAFFNRYQSDLAEGLTAAEMEENFKALATANALKPGELMLPFRMMLVGGKFGPGIFDIALTLGIAETKKRIAAALAAFDA